MQNIILIKRLEAIKEAAGTYSLKVTNLINNLLGEVRNEVLLEGAKSPTGKNRLKVALKVLNDNYEKHGIAPTALTLFTDDGRQVFEQYCYGALLAGDDIMSVLPRVDQDFEYSKINPIRKSAHYTANEFEGKYVFKIFAENNPVLQSKIDIKQALAIANTHKAVFQFVFIDHEGEVGRIAVSPDKFKELVTIADLSGVVRVTYQGEKGILLFHKDNGTIAALAPMIAENVGKDLQYKVDPDGSIDPMFEPEEIVEEETPVEEVASEPVQEEKVEEPAEDDWDDLLG